MRIGKKTGNIQYSRLALGEITIWTSPRFQEGNLERNFRPYEEFDGIASRQITGRGRDPFARSGEWKDIPDEKTNPCRLYNPCR
jgi:hypothetical protein